MYLVIFCIAMSGAYNTSGITQPTYTLYLAADREAMDWISRNTSHSSVFLLNSFFWGDDRAPSDGGGWLTFITDRESMLYNAANFEDDLEENKFDYVYIGRGYGNINSEILLKDPRFLLVYDEGGIKIFKPVFPPEENQGKVVR
jgi:hypothetical protein